MFSTRISCFFLFFFKQLYWSIIALQWCVSFCFITKWISYTYTYIPISSPSHHPYPTPLGLCKAPSWSPCAMWLLSTSYLFYIWRCIYVYATLSLCSSLLFPLPMCRVLKSVLYICVFIPVLPIGSSELFFFFRFHIYVLAYGIYFSLSD